MKYKGSTNSIWTGTPFMHSITVTRKGLNMVCRRFNPPTLIWSPTVSSTNHMALTTSRHLCQAIVIDCGSVRGNGIFFFFFSFITQTLISVSFNYWLFTTRLRRQICWISINTYFILQLSSVLVSSGKVNGARTVGCLVPKWVILASKPQEKKPTVSQGARSRCSDCTKMTK